MPLRKTLCAKLRFNRFSDCVLSEKKPRGMNFLRGFLLNQEMFEGFEKFRNVLCSVFSVPCFVLWVKSLLRNVFESLRV